MSTQNSTIKLEKAFVRVKLNAGSRLFSFLSSTATQITTL